MPETIQSDEGQIQHPQDNYSTENIQAMRTLDRQE